MKSHEIDMLGGSLPGNIFLYSLPLMCSNMLQILFNLADVAVVGKFAGTIALGSVGSTTIMITLTTGIMLGTASGVNAITALFLGAGEEEKVRKTVNTSLLICLAVGLCLLLFGLLFSENALAFIGTKDELIGGAALYMRIYLLGSPALALYNFGNAILSAAGDTKRPLGYLITAGIINVILNLVFVIGCHMDVAGVALASIISQYISAFLIMRYLLTCRESYRVSLKSLSFDSLYARKVLAISIPTAIQYTMFSIANLFIQSAVNSFDHVVVEGNSAAANADGLIYEVMAAFYTACTSFSAQNLGAGQKDRIKKIYFWTLLFSGGIAIIYGLVMLIFRIPFLSLFTSDPDVIYYGNIRLTILCFSFFISAFMDDSSAAARGLGKSVVPTIITIMGTVVYRIVWVMTVFAYFHTLTSLYLVYGTAFAFTGILGNIYYYIAYRKMLK